MSIALSIAFTGLCALIGDGDGKPGEILLLDAKGVGEVRGVTLPEHAPTLVVSLNDLANPDSSRPNRVKSLISHKIKEKRKPARTYQRRDTISKALRSVRRFPRGA